jgi:hypothetical protein
MSRRRYIRWIGVAAVALGIAAAVSVAGAARRDRSALDEVEGRRRAPEVEPVVLRFVHIPAESFVETLKQLGENPHVRDHLAQMPLAVNEPANAVVLIAPPEVADIMRGMADQLDQPNEFLVHEREREAEEFARDAEMRDRQRAFDRDQAQFELEMGRRRLELQRHDAAMRPEEAERHRREQEEAMRHRREQEGAEGRRHEPLQRLEEGQRKLGEMFERHRQEAEQHLMELERKRQHLKEEHRRRMEELGDRLGPDQREAREQILRGMREEMAGRWGDLRRSVMDRLGEILRPDQRERLKEWMGEPEPRDRPGPREPEPRDRPREDRPRPERQPEPLRELHRPSGLERPADCRLL